MNVPNRESNQIEVLEEHLHLHLKARMLQRGITKDEIERTLNEGWEALDAKPGTKGKVFVFSYQAKWEGQFFAEKEVSVYYKITTDGIILLTAKAKYGKDFPKR